MGFCQRADIVRILQTTQDSQHTMKVCSFCARQHQACRVPGAAPRRIRQAAPKERRPRAARQVQANCVLLDEIAVVRLQAGKSVAGSAGRGQVLPDKEEKPDRRQLRST